MADTVGVCIESGTKRVFASALDWPGWARSAKTEADAVATLLSYAHRYGVAIARARQGFTAPARVTVVERLTGGGSTDFGVPGREARSEGRPLDEAETKRQAALLKASWAAFDQAAEAARGVTLATGPRGGGRSRARMIDHVREAEAAYVMKMGGRPEGHDLEALRAAFLEALVLRAAGRPAPTPPKRAALWAPRYGVRRSAWHALDHAWEIEDRA
jgi:hypothetical protein